MKRIGVILLHIIVFWLSYEIIGVVVRIIGGFLYEKIFSRSFFNGFLTGNIRDFIYYTLTPAIMGQFVVFVTGKLHKKIKMPIAAFIVNACIMSWVIISHLISIITRNGLFSWDTVNQVWFDAILCGIIFWNHWNMIKGKHEA